MHASHAASNTTKFVTMRPRAGSPVPRTDVPGVDRGRLTMEGSPPGPAHGAGHHDVDHLLYSGVAMLPDLYDARRHLDLGPPRFNEVSL
jgi:hypothetical protein